jgi:hypothetical protein
MRYLIDGYNLAHAMNLLTGKALPPHRLERARQALLKQVCLGHGPAAADVTVVFDAARARRKGGKRPDFQGVRVLFSHGQSADDLIEELLRQEPAPRQLTVVSDDRRLREAARRRACPVLGCLDYLEVLAHPRPAAPPAPPPEEPLKPGAGSEADRRRWLDAFRDIDDDPSLRDEFDLHFPDVGMEDSPSP